MFTGCGYRWSAEDACRSISVPYVSGDQDGALTAEIIRRLCSSPHIRVSSDAPDRLAIAIVQEGADSIGYRRDPQKVKGKIRKNLVANEERKTMTVEVSLFRGCAEEPVFGPQRLSAYIDYDYIDGDSIQDLEFQNSSGQTVVVLPFSLGQLEPQEAAQEASNRPLYEKLSQKIVDVVNSQW
ncbi:MAG: hypothetical protein HW387_1399 [Parachlamydiales bacterium]|nr:hypothetical protein [Parachlamydiales bacterium]